MNICKLGRVWELLDNQSHSEVFAVEGSHELLWTERPDCEPPNRIAVCIQPNGREECLVLTWDGKTYKIEKFRKGLQGIVGEIYEYWHEPRRAA